MSVSCPCVASRKRVEQVGGVVLGVGCCVASRHVVGRVSKRTKKRRKKHTLVPRQVTNTPHKKYLRPVALWGWSRS